MGGGKFMWGIGVKNIIREKGKVRMGMRSDLMRWGKEKLFGELG